MATAHPAATLPLTTFDKPAPLRSAFVPVDGTSDQPPLARMPKLPPPLLRRHASLISTDTRFRAGARLLQSLWRADRALPLGTHESIDKGQRRKIKLGSRLTDRAAASGENFVSPAVANLVHRELVLREEGAAIDEDRLYANLLSSMPLAFNLFGPLTLDLARATAVWRRLLPAFVHTVAAIGFEHSPGRGSAYYLDDGTAFDVVLQVVTPDGEPAVVFVEMKYSEGMSGPAAALRPRYAAAARKVRLYRDPDSAALRTVALEQLWREHMLAQLTVDLGVVPRAHFVAVAPRLNRQAATAFRRYADELATPAEDADDRVGFSALTLEAFIEALADAGDDSLARQLWQRYADFDRILMLALQPSSARTICQRAAGPLATPQPPDDAGANGTECQPAAETGGRGQQLAPTTPRPSSLTAPRRERESLPGRRRTRSSTSGSATARQPTPPAAIAGTGAEVGVGVTG